MISAYSPQVVPGQLPADSERTGSVAELSSALRSAASENLAAVSGLHSFTEAVLLLALELLGLVGTKHRMHSFQIILNIGQTPEVVDIIKTRYRVG